MVLPQSWAIHALTSSTYAASSSGVAGRTRGIASSRSRYTTWGPGDREGEVPRAVFWVVRLCSRYLDRCARERRKHQEKRLEKGTRQAETCFQLKEMCFKLPDRI